ncbi:hypothetical protein [uncultured Sphingomonas sp.]|uniref:hypothetical protein n=1 Tax=uncultured Sphingomonas sp. TaxID=158754 RepID=UPI0025EFFF61|nr:hypothetical protein [uncultured Sphingomonas sp.]
MTVLPSHRRVQNRRRLVGTGQEVLQFEFARLQFTAPLRHSVERDRFLQIQVHEALLLAVDPADLGLGRIDVGARFHPEAVHLLRIGVAELSEDRRIKHAGAQCVEHAALQLVPADVDAIVAGAFVTSRRAPDQRCRDR